MLSPATIDLMSITGHVVAQPAGSASVESRSSVLRSTKVLVPEIVVITCGWLAQTTRSMFTHGLFGSMHSVLLPFVPAQATSP